MADETMTSQEPLLRNDGPAADQARARALSTFADSVRRGDAGGDRDGHWCGPISIEAIRPAMETPVRTRRQSCRPTDSQRRAAGDRAPSETSYDPASPRSLVATLGTQSRFVRPRHAGAARRRLRRSRSATLAMQPTCIASRWCRNRRPSSGRPCAPVRPRRSTEPSDRRAALRPQSARLDQRPSAAGLG